MKYNQLKALLAITKASFRAILSNPSSIFFSFLFPIVFILIFGAFSDRPAAPIKITFDENSDINNTLYDSIIKNKQISIVSYLDTTERNTELRQGKLAAIIDVQKANSRQKKYLVTLISSEASGNAVYQLLKLLDYQALKIELEDAVHMQREYAFQPQIVSGKKYRTIDFVLPGQLGFSILFSTLFGIAFLFFNLREQLVLKRFYASPVNRINILIGIGTSRLFYQLINVVVLILFGHFVLHFTLFHGAVTFLEMLLLTVYMLFLLMGVGLIVSSISKTDTMIPLMINIFGFPQMLLSGTFFSIEVFPKWMQIICEALPLTQFNNAMRKISFEGLHLYDCGKEIGILSLWMILTYVVVMKVMKWE